MTTSYRKCLERSQSDVGRIFRKPAMEQVVIRAPTNEGGLCAEVLDVREATYAALIESSSLDAGCCSEANTRLVAHAHTGDIFGLNGKQPE